jgi:hypothetical protein
MKKRSEDQQIRHPFDAAYDADVIGIEITVSLRLLSAGRLKYRIAQLRIPGTIIAMVLL